MHKPDVTLPLPDDLRQQLQAFQTAGLLDGEELRQVGVALLQRLGRPAIGLNPWSGNRNAPPLVQRGV